MKYRKLRCWWKKLECKWHAHYWYGDHIVSRMGKFTPQHMYREPGKNHGSNHSKISSRNQQGMEKAGLSIELWEWSSVYAFLMDTVLHIPSLGTRLFDPMNSLANERGG